jgi:hypothetical protein
MLEVFLWFFIHACGGFEESMRTELSHTPIVIVAIATGGYPAQLERARIRI